MVLKQHGYRTQQTMAKTSQRQWQTQSRPLRERHYTQSRVTPGNTDKPENYLAPRTRGALATPDRAELMQWPKLTETTVSRKHSNRVTMNVAMRRGQQTTGESWPTLIKTTTTASQSLAIQGHTGPDRHKWSKGTPEDIPTENGQSQIQAKTQSSVATHWSIEEVVTNTRSKQQEL